MVVVVCAGADGCCCAELLELCCSGSVRSMADICGCGASGSADDEADDDADNSVKAREDPGSCWATHKAGTAMKI